MQLEEVTRAYRADERFDEMTELYVLDNKVVRLLPKYNGDKAFVALHIRMFDLLEEHNVNVRTKMFPFGFGGIPTFGAFRWPVLRSLYMSYILYPLLTIAFVFLTSLEVMTVGETCVMETIFFSYFILWMCSTMVEIETYCIPRLLVHLRKAREVKSVLKAHKALENKLVAEVDIDQDLSMLEEIIKGDLERLSGIKYWITKCEVG